MFYLRFDWKHRVVGSGPLWLFSLLTVFAEALVVQSTLRNYINVSIIFISFL